MCGHTLAVAEKTGRLSAFLKWYATKYQNVDITTVGMLNMPQGRGRKGGVPKRKRSRKQASDPVVVTSRPSLSANVCSSSSTAVVVAERSSGPLLETFNYQSPSYHYTSFGGPSGLPSSPALTHVFPPHAQPYSDMQSSNTGSSALSQSFPPPAQPYSDMQSNSSALSRWFPPSAQPYSDMQSSNSPWCYPYHQPAPVPSPNPNPFYLKFISGNIRTCQGCKGSLRAGDSSIPASPNNLCIARAEKRPYRNNSGNLVTPTTYKPSHYHAMLLCIQAVEPHFVPHSLQVPSDISPQLTMDHKNHLWVQFGLRL